jgi:hypothetical protein
LGRANGGADQVEAAPEVCGIRIGRSEKAVSGSYIGDSKLINTLSAILVAYCWIAAAVLILFLFLIGRFYERRFGQRSYYQLLLLPLGLFVVAALWDATLANRYTGDPLLDFVGAPGPDLIWLLGGTILIVLCYSLFRTMMGGRR